MIYLTWGCWFSLDLFFCQIYRGVCFLHDRASTRLQYLWGPAIAFLAMLSSCLFCGAFLCVS
jgi:hypothetical protein